MMRGRSFYLVTSLRPILGDKVVHVFFNDVSNYAFPVLPNGKVHEIVDLFPVDLDIIEKAQEASSNLLAFKKLSRIEATWRMANRVFDCFTRWPTAQRRELGLTFSLALFDLPRAYEIASAPRWALSYESWCQRFERFIPAELSAAEQHISQLTLQPHFIVLLVQGDCQDGWARSVQSLHNQAYLHFSVVMIADSTVSTPEGVPVVARLDRANVASTALNTLLKQLTQNDSTWLLMLRAGHALSWHALYWLACDLNRYPDAQMIYSDDDVLDRQTGQLTDRFKPDWCLLHFLSHNFIGDALALRVPDVLMHGGISAECLQFGLYGLTLRCLQPSDAQVIHSTAVLLHSDAQVLDGGKLQDEWERSASQSFVLSHDSAALVVPVETGIRRIKRSLPDPLPLVSVIIPTRDAVAVLKVCIDSLLNRTEYPAIELLIVDNQSSDPAALAYLAELDGLSRTGLSIRVLRYPHRFNYSAINNFAVTEATGDVVCLLNNDTEVITPDWLSEMVSQLYQPKVGAVGAKLFYSDNTVQHAGDVLGAGGCANHLHSRIGPNDPGYCRRAILPQRLSAVTAACLLTHKQLYLDLGGLDDRWLRVAFNDVDYCLKINEAGLKVIWTPYAKLYHHESLTRGKDTRWRQVLRAESEVWVMRRRWKKYMQHDPFYNPNLSYIRPDFSMSPVRRVPRPWER